MEVCQVAVALGTRPEAVKLAPVISLLRGDPAFATTVIATAQHRQMLDQFLHTFGIHPDRDLDLMRPQQTLTDLSAAVLQGMGTALAELRPDVLLVQGDTTTVFFSALAAFYARIPVGHVEAGLRSRDLYNPFPEEANRALTSVLTTMHFAPTDAAKRNLLQEGVPPERIIVTGNTVVDALQMLPHDAAQLPAPAREALAAGRRLILVTAHRRESWGSDLQNICGALVELVDAFADVDVVFPVHLNPAVRNEVFAQLGGRMRIHLLDPLEYIPFTALLRASYLVLTDSGGVQEEAPSFGKPVLVLRRVTERPEAAEAGISRVVGTSKANIVREASRLLANDAAYAEMAAVSNPYGDGRASMRIVSALRAWWQNRSPWCPQEEQFKHAAAPAAAINRMEQ